MRALLKQSVQFGHWATSRGPGLALALAIAVAAFFISDSQGGPQMLYALLFGMAFHFLQAKDSVQPGIQFGSRTLLRLGVALLGARIAVSDITALGGDTVILVIAGVALTLIGGSLIARLMGLKADYAVLSAGAVAICGASAALAIAAVLPQNQRMERNTLITVAGVTGLSTAAMILYPVLIDSINLSDRNAGIFIGATIHDVAQVVGAGYMISPEAGETATIVKLMRVACLAPVVLIIGQIFKAKAANGARSDVPILPLFMVFFLGFVALNSVGFLPNTVTDILNQASKWALLIAVSALGVKTSLAQIFAPGIRPLLALLLQTLFLAIFAFVALTLV